MRVQLNVLKLKKFYKSQKFYKLKKFYKLHYSINFKYIKIFKKRYIFKFIKKNNLIKFKYKYTHKLKINKNINLTLIIKKTKNNWFFHLTDYTFNSIFIISIGHLKPKIKNKKLKKSHETFLEILKLLKSKYELSYNISRKPIHIFYYKIKSYFFMHSLKIYRILQKFYKFKFKNIKLIYKITKAHNGCRYKKIRRI